MRPLRFAYVYFCLVLPTVALAQSPFRSDLPQISWDKAPEHYGQECVVYGTVVAARDIGSRCFLNFHANFRENFTVVITKENYAKFSEAPDKLFSGKHVRVVGKIVEYQNKPEIIVTGPEQIEIIADPTPPAPAAGSAPPAAGATPAPSGGQSKPAPPTPVNTTPAGPPAAGGVVKIATFNVLNLFDDLDDPYVESEELPGKNAEETAKVAALLRKIGADVVALEEIESRPVVQRFVDAHLKDFNYEVVQFEGNSDRGIDVALLSRLPVREVTSHRHFAFNDGNGKPMRFQRDLLQVRIAPEGFLPFDVFVVHLKSKRGGADDSLPLRMGEASEIRKLFDELLHQDSQARFVICGDFNDTLESTPIQTILGQGANALRSFVDDLPADQRITYNREHLSMIDYIFASAAMGATYVPKSYGVSPGSVEVHGSDHNPIFASFKLTPRSSGN